MSIATFHRSEAPFDLRERIRRLAREHGFDLAGFAPAGPAPMGDLYTDWLRQGFHGGMQYMARSPDVRLDIRRWAPETRTVLVVAVSYYTDVRFAASELITARYALGEDYHLWLKKRLIVLGRRIAEESPVAVRWRSFLDTAPVLERAYAAAAGIGWIGKNSMLIHPRIGSYTFLGGLALSLELPPDPPMADHCGRCTRCMEACPTGAIVAPRVVDARRCIAYHTIESRAPIPAALVGAMGRRFFGCDICQEVCPMNREPGRSEHPNLTISTEPKCRARPQLFGLTPERVLAMPDSELLTMCRRSPLRRAGFAGLRRTAAALASAAHQTGQADGAGA